LAASLGLSNQALLNNHGVAVLAGSEIPTGAFPLAQAYAGHQFGHFTMLGDGRAVLLGEQITPLGLRFDIQLKGSGRTPYSRGGDGRATLGPMLREYIISEAMYGLGIPTTRSLAVVTTGESVLRETEEPGAIMTRVAASHLRVGTFEYAANLGTLDDVKSLADYTLQRHFPYFETNKNKYLFLLEEIIKRQGSLIAKWQLVGFIHGVMNTDNMAISGETIDYGPCAFMDTYDPSTVFSSIDLHGRYAYGNQPNIAMWNLTRLGETLLPLIHEDQAKAIELVKNALLSFSDIYHSNWLDGMRAKLGIFNRESEDEPLIDELLRIMQKYSADYTNTFRSLTLDNLNDAELFGTDEFHKWHELWMARLKRQQEPKASVSKLMLCSNPAVIPRNHLVEEALEAAVKKGDYSVMERLLEALKNPYAHSPNQDAYITPPDPKAACGYKTYCGT